jgi:hypothetical protein
MFGVQTFKHKKSLHTGPQGSLELSDIGIMTAYLVSVIGSLLGVYVGVRINQNYLD